MTPRILDVLPRPVAWVLTSGGGRAAAQVGMVEVLLEQEYQPDLIVGSSFGAINAAALPGTSPDLGRLRMFWEKLPEQSVFSSLGTAAVRGLGPRTSKHAREFRSLIASALAASKDTQIPAELVLVASDLETGRSVMLRQGQLVEAVAAACTLPVVLPPVEIDGRLLIDGGMSASAPLQQAVDAGAKSIVLLDTATSAVPEAELKDIRWWQIAALSYNHQIRSQIGLALPSVAEQVPVALISADEGRILEFTEPQELFQAGRRAAARALASELRDQNLARPGVHGVLARERIDQ